MVRILPAWPPREIQEFNRIKRELHQKVKTNIAITDNEYKLLIDSHSELTVFYTQRNDEKNKTLDSANFFYIEAFYYLDKGLIAQSVSSFLMFLDMLFERYNIQSFNIQASLTNIQPYVIRLDNKKGKQNYLNITVLNHLYSLSDKILKTGLPKSDLHSNLHFFVRLVLIDIKNNIKKYEEGFSDIFKIFEELLVNIKRIFQHEEKLYNVSLLNSVCYRILKQVLFRKILVKDLNQLNICANFMRSTAYEACETYLTFCRSVNKFNKSVILGLEIDKEYANYYYYYYYDLNPRKAIDALKKVESKLILAKIEDDVEREMQINYFERELSHFITFFKLLLLRSEIKNKQKILKDKWEQDMYAGICEHVEASLNMFRRRQDIDINDFDLRIISSTFSGIIAELFIYRILTGLVGKKNKTDDISKQELVEFVHTIENLPVESIKLREDIVSGAKKTDADIHIQIDENTVHCVSIKNRPIGRCKDALKRELEIFQDNNVKQVYCLVNLLKTSKEDYDWLKKHASEKHPQIKLTIFDIREFVDQLLHLDPTTKALISFNLELYSLLDY